MTETSNGPTSGAARPLNAPFRIVVPVVLTVVLFVGTLFGLFLPILRENLIADRREMIRQLTLSVLSAIDGHYRLEQQGRLTREMAQQQAVEQLRHIRYGAEGKDYFWINDMGPTLIMHPYRQDLEGKRIADFTDPTGKRLFVEMVETVRRLGEGYVDYQWQWMDDSSRIVPKISFVKGFAPWNWVVGTGIYVEDVREQVGAVTRKLTLVCLAILVAMAALSAIIIWQGARAEAARQYAEDQARRHREQLFQADKMATLGTLVSGVAHEVNNPVTFILLNAPILAKVWDSIIPLLDNRFQSHGDFKVGQMEYSRLRERVPVLVRNIGEGARRIKSIVGDLKDYARPDPPARSDDIHINAVVEKAMGLVNNLIRKRTQQLQVELADDLPVFPGSAQRIEQVLINLLVNACQALDSPSQSVRIATATDSRRRFVTVTVQDHGRGIPPEIVNRIRDPFFTTKRESGGTGLGLAIADRIVNEHGGHMQFTSVPGQGTTVAVHFPAAADS